MRIALLNVLLLFAAQFGLYGNGRNAEDRVTELIGRHLDQSARLESSPAEQAPLIRGGESLDVVAKKWIERVDSWPRNSPLLEAVPEGVWERVAPGGQGDDGARDLLERPVSLPEFLALVALRDPQIRSRQEALAASLRRFPQAEYLNDLMVRYRAFLREASPVGGAQLHKEKPQATYPFPAGLTLKGRIAELQVKLAEIEYESVLRSRLNSAARDSFELRYTDRAIEITKENRALLANMESIAIAQLRVGRASQAEALWVQTMLDLLDDRLYALRKEREIVAARLCSTVFLDGPVSWRWLETALMPPEVGVSELVRLAQETNQDLAAARTQLELLETTTALAENSLPLAASPASRIDLNAGAEAGPTRNDKTTFPEMRVASQGAASAGQNLAYLEELKVRLKELREHVSSTEAEVAYRVQEAFARFKASEKDFRVRSESVVPKLKRVFNTTLQKYNTGRVSFIEFADAGRDYLDALIDTDRAQFTREAALIGIQDSIGRSVLDLIFSGLKE